MLSRIVMRRSPGISVVSTSQNFRIIRVIERQFKGGAIFASFTKRRLSQIQGFDASNVTQYQNFDNLRGLSRIPVSVVMLLRNAMLKSSYLGSRATGGRPICVYQECIGYLVSLPPVSTTLF
jgi:hypothetical protein